MFYLWLFRIFCGLNDSLWDGNKIIYIFTAWMCLPESNALYCCCCCYTLYYKIWFVDFYQNHKKNSHGIAFWQPLLAGIIILQSKQYMTQYWYFLKVSIQICCIHHNGKWICLLVHRSSINFECCGNMWMMMMCCNQKFFHYWLMNTSIALWGFQDTL